MPPIPTAEELAPRWREKGGPLGNYRAKKLPEQMSIKMENQRDWIHVVTEYYSDGNLHDYITKNNKMKEYEIA